MVPLEYFNLPLMPRLVAFSLRRILDGGVKDKSLAGLYIIYNYLSVVDYHFNIRENI